MPAPDYAAELTNLRTALGTGELTVEINGERVTYRSTTDILTAITYFGSIATPAAGSSSSRTTLAAYSGD